MAAGKRANDTHGMRQILCPVVVGRHEELDLLQATLDEARAGRGRLVLIRGEAGVGKSRLTLQLEQAARSAGMQVLRGRAAASSSPVPFRPFAEALLGATRAAGPPQAPELAAYRSVLGALIPEWSKEGPPVADRTLLLHEAALRLLRVLAGDVGALLTLEDLHWADAETLALVEYLADNVAAERLLCVATIRSDEPRPAPMLPALLAMRRNALVLDLERLSDAEVEAMASAALDAPSLPDELGPLLASRAEGVPFLSRRSWPRAWQAARSCGSAASGSCGPVARPGSLRRSRGCCASACGASASATGRCWEPPRCWGGASTGP